MPTLPQTNISHCKTCKGHGVIDERIGNHDQERPCPECNADKR